jgi:hypothetical protein
VVGHFWKAEVGHFRKALKRILADHADWLQAHDRAMAEAAERDARIDARIEKLVPAFGEYIRQNQAEPR